jgi:hypothetical protein
VQRGGHQAIKHWLLRIVLINSYLLVYCSEVPEPREVLFKSQQDFKRKLISGLIAKGRDSEICPKRRISRISQTAIQTLVQSHKQVKIAKRGRYVAYKGLRYRDKPRKKITLGQIVFNLSKESNEH